MDKFNLSSAMIYAKMGKVEDWVHNYLNDEGNNRALSDGLKTAKRYWIGPILFNLDRLKRCCGPEENMEFLQQIEEWENRITSMQVRIKSGWDMPPLILTNDDGELSVRDGNHRMEALQREKIKEYWVIIWDNECLQNLKVFNSEG